MTISHFLAESNRQQSGLRISTLPRFKQIPAWLRGAISHRVRISSPFFCGTWLTSYGTLFIEETASGYKRENGYWKRFAKEIMSTKKEPSWRRFPFFCLDNARLYFLVFSYSSSSQVSMVKYWSNTGQILVKYWSNDPILITFYHFLTPINPA